MRLIAMLISLSLLATPAFAHDKIAANVTTALSLGGKASVLATLSDQVNVAKIANTHAGDDRLISSVAALRSQAERSQTPLRAWLDQRGVRYQSFWVANFIALDVDQNLLSALAQRKDIAAIELNSRLALQKPVAENPGATKATTAIEPGVNQIHAPALWAMGFRGQGVIVAGQDTGYQWDHLALKRQYAGWNGSTVDHNYNWHDGIHSSSGPCPGNSPAPCDDNSHGTHTMGTMVGDDGDSNQIGVAPSARWIACRNMNQGDGTPTTYSECFQWFMAPTDLAGNNPDPTRAPHVINNSWGCPTSEGCTAPNVMQTVVENVRNAGILVVVSAGNSGSSCSSISDPAAIYAASLTVGNLNGTVMAGSSSRGPVLVDGSQRLKPEVSAPGTSVRSATPGNAYGYKSGTSMAGPHVAGLAALLMSVDPTLKRDPARIEALLRDTAVADITTVQTCGGTTSPVTIPNNTFGYGRIDALTAARDGLGLLFAQGFD